MLHFSEENGDKRVVALSHRPQQFWVETVNELIIDANRMRLKIAKGVSTITLFIKHENTVNPRYNRQMRCGGQCVRYRERAKQPNPVALSP
jgi:hypothetical protein